MSKIKDVAEWIEEMLDRIEVPYTYGHYEEGQATPYIVWYNPHTELYGADAARCLMSVAIKLELQTSTKDWLLEERIERELARGRTVEGRVIKTEDYDASENVYTITYEFTVKEVRR